MNKEAVQRLREPAAWVLLGAAGLQLLSGLVLLFVKRNEGDKFTYKALNETLDAGTFAGMALAALLVVAVFLVTSAETPTPQARTIVMAALGIFALAILLGVIAWLAGLVAGGDGFKISAGVKLSAFLYGAAKLAVLGIGAWYAWTLFQGMQPARPAAPMPGQQGYPDYGYQQGQQQYGQPGYGQPVEGQPAQPHYEQPSYDQQQQYQQQPYEQQQQPQQYEQQQYDQQQYGQGGYQQPQPGYPPQGGQSLEEESAGEWTRAYGEEQQQYGQSPEQHPQQPPPGYGQQGYGQQHEQRPDNGGEWYRDSRPPQ